MIGIVLPTRGLVFTEVEEYIEKVRNDFPTEIKVFRSHNLPIPESFNELVEKALADEAVHVVWFLEEDTVPPDGVFEQMLNALSEVDITCVDYGFNGGFNTIVRSDITGDILFCGFGCTMVKRSVFEKMEKPYFRSDKAYNLSIKQWVPANPHAVYGMHDIYFFSMAKKLGFRIKQVDGECRHLQLNQLGNKEVNDGRHVIGEKDHISRKLTIPVDVIPL